jgi:hypothetical protein
MRYIMAYEDKIHEILNSARDAEERGDLDKLAALENSLIKARTCRLGNPRRADQILDEALGKGDNGD